MLEKRIVDVGDGRKYIEVKGADIPGELSEVKLTNDKLMLVGIGKDNKIHPAYIYYPMFGQHAWNMESVTANDGNIVKAVEECAACDTMTVAWKATDTKPTTPAQDEYQVGKPVTAPQNIQVPASMPKDEPKQISASSIPLPYVMAGIEVAQGLICKKKSAKFLTNLVISGVFDYISNWPEDKGLQQNLKDVSALYAARMKICESDLPEFESEVREAYKTYKDTNDLLEGVRKGMFGSPSKQSDKNKGSKILTADLTSPIATRGMRIF